MSYRAGPGDVHSHSIDVANSGPCPTTNVVSSGAAWPSANMAIYVPIVVQRRIKFAKMWFQSSTTGTGNYDIGLYDAGGTRLLSRGSTAKPTTNGAVVWDCTDTTIGPGIYYLALASDSGTDTFYRQNLAAPACAAYGVLTEASAFALPATATFAVNQTLAYLPSMGLLLNTLWT